MTCKEFRKYLYAFADGELDTKENLDVLEHLNMCPDCCRKGSAQQELRRRIAYVFRQESAPPSLRERIAQALAHEATKGRVITGRRRVIRLFVPLAAAAVLAVLVWPRHDAPAASPPAHALVEQHRGCWQKHDRRFGSGPLAGRALAARLDMPICAPDLTEAGFTFHSADECHLPDHLGSHLFYQAAGDPNLIVSVFSMRPKVNLAAWEQVKRENGQSFRFAEDGTYQVVAWECPDASHLMCAEWEREKLFELAAVACRQQVKPSRLASVAMLAGAR